MANNGRTPSKAPGFIPITEANLPKKGLFGFGGPGDFTKLFHEIVKNQNNTEYLGRQVIRLETALTLNNTPIMEGKGFKGDEKEKTEVLLHLTKLFFNKRLCHLNDRDGCKIGVQSALLGQVLSGDRKNYVFVESKKLFDEYYPYFNAAYKKFKKAEEAAQVNEIMNQTAAVVSLEAMEKMPQSSRGTPASGTGLGGGKRKTNKRKVRKSKKSKKTRKH
jgi:hypothetical protein